MKIFSVKGTIVALGNSIIRPGWTRYSSVEIESADGTRSRIKGLMVVSDVSGVFDIGADGEFFIFKGMNGAELYGVKLANGLSAVVKRASTFSLSLLLIFGGALLTPFAIGFIFVPAGIVAAVQTMRAGRAIRENFYSPDARVAPGHKLVVDL